MASRIHSATGDGNGAATSSFCARDATSASGNTASRVVTTGFASISAAWFSVMPVIANNRMPMRQIAPLIQCHCRNWVSQKSLRLPLGLGFGRAGDGAATAPPSGFMAKPAYDGAGRDRRKRMRLLGILH